MKEAIDILRNKEPNFRMIFDTYGPPKPVVRPQGFATLCKIIFEQQVSLESAKACYDKLDLAFNGEFTPQNILKSSDEILRNAGLSRQKSAYVRNLANAIVNGDLDLDSFNQKSPEQIRTELIKIKGIGNWTIDVYLMFSLQSPDIIPLADIGIIITIKELWEIEDKNEILNLTDTWKPYRTAASFFLWHYYLRKRNRVIHP